MNYKLLIFSALLFILGQSLVWIQTNGPLVWPSIKTYKWALLLLGMPITALFMHATKLAVGGFDGEFWPARFVSFVSGIIIFSIFTWLFKGEGITMKTMISLALSVIIIFIQLFWK